MFKLCTILKRALVLIISMFFIGNNLAAADYPYTGFAIGTDGNLYLRVGIDNSNLDRTGWAKINLPAPSVWEKMFNLGQPRVKDATISPQGKLWIVYGLGQIISTQLSQAILKNTQPNTVINVAWSQSINPHPNGIAITGISSGYGGSTSKGVVWALAKDDSVLYKKEEESAWKGGPAYSARLRYIATSPTARVVYGVSSDGNYWFRDNMSYGPDWNLLGNFGPKNIYALSWSLLTYNVLSAGPIQFYSNEANQAGITLKNQINIGHDFKGVAAFANIIWFIDTWNNVYLRTGFNKLSPTWGTGRPLNSSSLKVNKVVLGGPLFYYPQ